MNDDQTSKEKFLSVNLLLGWFATWSVLIALGSYFFGSSLDWRKPLLVLIVCGLFVGTWWLALRAKNKCST